jgi:alkylhydroperoxidase family enzyme
LVSGPADRLLRIDNIANACSYCVHSHTAAARANGMTDAQHAELLAIVALAARTNHLANGLQVPLDPVFDRGTTFPAE